MIRKGEQEKYNPVNKIMAESSELNKIKKEYGERFMKLCRKLFPTILEDDGVLYNVLTSSFANNSKTLYDDIQNASWEENFKNYVYSKIALNNETEMLLEEKTPYELLNDAGYDLFECKTEEEIQSFKKYYDKHEELCTFHGGRLDSCVVFFAVKKDVDNIKRKDFTEPKREDKYGTSVMGIQFEKQGICTVSIKNRYNHTVENPDATYGNNLDRIVPGLTQSFTNLLLERGLELNTKNKEEFKFPGYVLANDGKYYKYNMEINRNYYCPGNVIIKAGEPIKLENPEKQMLVDYFIIDRENKTVIMADERENDSFIDDLKDIEKIDVLKDIENKNNRVILIKKNNSDKTIKIKIDVDNQILEYENNELKQVGDAFLSFNKVLKKLKMSNLEQVENYFLNENERLEKLELPRLEQIGNGFLDYNKALEKLELPNLKRVGDHFMDDNEALKELELPKLKQVGTRFLSYNEILEKLELPKLEQVGDCFLSENRRLKKLELQNLKQAGDFFISENVLLEKVKFPNLEQVGEDFLGNNKALKNLELPNLKQAGNFFMYENTRLKELKLPNLKQAGNFFLEYNVVLEQLELPNLKQIGNNFLKYNARLEKLELLNLEQVGNGFLCNNNSLKKLIFPNLTKTGYNFLFNNRVLEQLELPNLPKIKERFKPIIARNLQKEVLITPKHIAKLDKDNNITETEINSAREKFMEMINEKEKNENEKEM